MAEKMAEQERGVSTNKNNNKKWETFIVGFTLPQADQNNPKLKKKKSVTHITSCSTHFEHCLLMTVSSYR